MNIFPKTDCLQIFVVENDADTLRYLGMYLEQLGHKVNGAASMHEALQSEELRSCDVLISDVGLPDGNAWELLQRAQLSEPVYAIAMSGSGALADRARSREAGFRQLLLKPFMPDDLDAMLEEAAAERMSGPENIGSQP